MRTLGPNGVTSSPAIDQTSTRLPSRGAIARDLPKSFSVTEDDVRKVPVGGQLSVPPQALVTPLARDIALERRIDLVQEPGSVASGMAQVQPRSIPTPSTDRTVALGADHGGYEMKKDLAAYLGELGYEVVDCGTYNTDSVDYPDFAYAVARSGGGGACLAGHHRGRRGHRLVHGCQQGARRTGGDVLRPCHGRQFARAQRRQRPDPGRGAGGSQPGPPDRQRPGWRPTLVVIAMPAGWTRSWASNGDSCASEQRLALTCPVEWMQLDSSNRRAIGRTDHKRGAASCLREEEARAQGDSDAGLSPTASASASCSARKRYSRW